MQSITELKETAESVQADGDHLQEVLGGERDERRTSGHSQETIDYMVGLLEGARDGDHRAQYLLREALTLSDFPNLFGDTIDRAMLAYYQAWIPAWQQFCNVGAPIKDFRTAKRFDIQGMQNVLDAVGERAEYKERGPTDASPKTIAVTKYGGKFGISFESLINDDLGALAVLPQRLAVAARRTEAVQVAALYVGAAGYNTNVYSAGNKNLVSTANGATANNMPLSITSLGQAMMIMGQQLDPDGHPILVDAYTLVVPPALEVVANNILHAVQFVATGIDGGYGASGTAGINDSVWAQNWLTNKLSLVVDPYITWTATSNKGTAWFLFANPKGFRPAIELDYLSGHEAPELFMKMPDATRLGGAAEVTDFASDTCWYRVRHTFGTVVIDPKLTLASNGSGS